MYWDIGIEVIENWFKWIKIEVKVKVEIKVEVKIKIEWDGLQKIIRYSSIVLIVMQI